MNVYIKNTGKSQLNYLMLHLTLLEKEEPKPAQERNNKNKG
jgi:hypothetical protein